MAVIDGCSRKIRHFANFGRGARFLAHTLSVTDGFFQQKSQRFDCFHLENDKFSSRKNLFPAKVQQFCHFVAEFAGCLVFPGLNVVSSLVPQTLNCGSSTVRCWKEFLVTRTNPQYQGQQELNGRPPIMAQVFPKPKKKAVGIASLRTPGQQHLFDDNKRSQVKWHNFRATSAKEFFRGKCFA